MSMIPDEIIEQVRDAADLVGIIGESVELKRTGADYRGACPFHGGTHRNFAVIPKKNLYYCYVCHAAGDVFTYFMRKFGMDYPTAVREAARRSGIVIPEQPGRAGPDPREPLFSAVGLAQDWFARQLTENPEAETARKYLASRGLDMETVQPLGLGFAPRGDVFQAAMAKHQITQQVMLEAGLLHQRDDGRVNARFRGRLLFPIHDLRGRVVGFGGRIIGEGEPKYLNSPETPIFHKGSMLYNLHQAKQAIRKDDVAVLVEGYFDVLRLVLAGIENVVAPMGTALTADQAGLLKRFASTVILVYDSDSAGQRATFRAADELLRREARVRVATLPPGEDPDTLVKAGGARAMEPILRDAMDVLERKIQLLEEKGWFRDVEHRREALDRLLPTVRAARDPITRDLYLGVVAERTGVSKAILEEEVRQEVREPAPPPPVPSAGRNMRTPRVVTARRPGERAEKALLQVILQFEGWLERAATEVRPEWFEGRETREIFEAVVKAGHRTPALEVVESLSPAAQALWNELMVPIPADERAAAETYVGAREYLEGRPDFQAYETIREAAEKAQRRKELETRYPSAAKKYLLGLIGKRLRQPR